MGMSFGKCCSRFTDNPPLCDKSEESYIENLSNGQTEVFYQCSGTTVVQESSFLSKSPWMIPFDIASFQGDSLSDLRTTLPRTITVDGRMYVLVGFTLYKEEISHFTAAVMWRSKWWFYDGLAETDQTRITAMKEANLFGHTGSFAIYVLF